MNTFDILQMQDHRTWKPPSGDWKYYQEWKDVIFLHWEVDESELRRFVPGQLTIDTFQGKAWMSVVAFKTQGVRRRGAPPLPLLSNFYEVNIRTYVKNSYKDGIYFLNLEASKFLSSVLTRFITELPYYYSTIESTVNMFKCVNSEKQSHLHIRYETETTPVQKTELDRWLTERYVLFQDGVDDIVEFNIHHIEWPLQKVKVDTLALSYPSYNFLLEGFPTRVGYSPGVQVLIWEKYKWHLSGQNARP